MVKSIEKPLERSFVKWCKEYGIRAVKGPAYTDAGIPDRIVVIPHGGGTIWVEFKGGTAYGLTPIQEWWKRLLISSDPKRYFCIDSKEDLEKLKEHCLTLMSCDGIIQ